MNIIRKATAWLLAVLFVVSGTVPVMAEELTLQAESVYLAEAQTGKVLYESNADQRRPLASVTKIMTLLLVCEAMEEGKFNLQDTVQVSANAASMGGSQIFLEAGEIMTVEDMIKSVVVASANDAAVALAEFTCGSEEAFVARMNQRAEELGMKNTHFVNPNGLDDDTDDHYSSARDIALMSAALMRHEVIFRYTQIWQDTVRDGAFTLTNTNRLVRFYQGATGLKTGSTSKAKYCISATAMRDGLHLIAVVMGSPTRDIRNETAKKLLDYGFAHYGFYNDTECYHGKVVIKGSDGQEAEVQSASYSTVTDKGDAGKIKKEVILYDNLQAPMRAGARVGCVQYKIGEKLLCEMPVTLTRDVEKISFLETFLRGLHTFFLS